MKNEEVQIGPLVGSSPSILHSSFFVLHSSFFEMRSWFRASVLGSLRSVRAAMIADDSGRAETNRPASCCHGRLGKQRNDPQISQFTQISRIAR
jgi:hypothetical protein